MKLRNDYTENVFQTNFHEISTNKIVVRSWKMFFILRHYETVRFTFVQYQEWNTNLPNQFRKKKPKYSANSIDTKRQ